MDNPTEDLLGYGMLIFRLSCFLRIVRGREKSIAVPVRGPHPYKWTFAGCPSTGVAAVASMGRSGDKSPSKSHGVPLADFPCVRGYLEKLDAKRNIGMSYGVGASISLFRPAGGIFQMETQSTSCFDQRCEHERANVPPRNRYQPAPFLPAEPRGTGVGRFVRGK